MKEFELLAKRMRQLLYPVRHPLGHLGLRNVAARAKIRGFSGGGRRAAWKYIGLYLDSRIGPGERRNLIAYHYKWMLATVPRALTRQGAGEGVMVWDSVGKDGAAYSITLRPATICPMEGELELLFQDGEGRLAFLTFLMVPGARYGVGDGPAILIGGIQGGYGRREDYRRAAKNNGEVTPINLLVIAARAFADAAGATSLLAVPDEGQVARVYADHKMYLNYNRTWAELGGEQTGAGYFALEIYKNSDRSLDHLSASHRARARRKVAFKAQVQDQMRQRFADFLRPIAKTVEPTGWIATSAPIAVQ